MPRLKLVLLPQTKPLTTHPRPEPGSGKPNSKGRMRSDLAPRHEPTMPLDVNPNPQP